MHQLYAVLVGIVWGATNPFIKSGSAKLSEKQAADMKQSSIERAKLLLQTPSFWVPQLLNIGGAIGFAWLLSVGEISVVGPIANATSLAVNTVVDLVVGERFDYRLLFLGLCLVAIGIVLCTA